MQRKKPSLSLRQATVGFPVFLDAEGDNGENISPLLRTDLFLSVFLSVM
jgi:hypothetical protein